jgi:hypothetical protein
MSTVKKQALIEAPVETLWELIGDPERHPEWWPKIVEVNGERFLEGDEYAQVVRSPGGAMKSDFVVEERDELRQIRLRCQTTGMYADWRLTNALDGTFVDAEFGMDARRAFDKVFDVVAGRMYFRRWLDQSVEGLREASCSTEVDRSESPGVV